nr:hypothetical protein [Tanacetum cinerariifolium]
MLVPAQEEELGEGLTIPSAPQHTPIIQPLTSKPQKKQKPWKSKQKDTQETQPKDQEMFDTDVLNDEEVVVEDINAATTTVVSINDITLAQVHVEIKTSKPKARCIIMQEPSKNPTTTIPISSKFQDKGKGIMVEEPLKMKKKNQISLDEQEARRLQVEIDEQDRLAEEKEKA